MGQIAALVTGPYAHPADSPFHAPSPMHAPIGAPGAYPAQHPYNTVAPMHTNLPGPGQINAYAPIGGPRGPAPHDSPFHRPFGVEHPGPIGYPAPVGAPIGHPIGGRPMGPGPGPAHIPSPLHHPAAIMGMHPAMGPNAMIGQYPPHPQAYNGPAPVYPHPHDPRIGTAPGRFDLPQGGRRD